MALADQPEIRFVISNTTEAGIAYAVEQIIDLVAQGVDGIHL